MNYVYFVAYAHSRGFGNVEIMTENPILNYSDVTGIENTITNDNIGKVVVLNYQLISQKED